MGPLDELKSTAKDTAKEKATETAQNKVAEKANQALDDAAPDLADKGSFSWEDADFQFEATSSEEEKMKAMGLTPDDLKTSESFGEFVKDTASHLPEAGAALVAGSGAFSGDAQKVAAVAAVASPIIKDAFSTPDSSATSSLDANGELLASDMSPEQIEQAREAYQNGDVILAQKPGGDSPLNDIQWGGDETVINVDDEEVAKYIRGDYHDGDSDKGKAFLKDTIQHLPEAATALVLLDGDFSKDAKKIAAVASVVTPLVKDVIKSKKAADAYDQKNGLGADHTNIDSSAASVDNSEPPTPEIAGTESSQPSSEISATEGEAEPPETIYMTVPVAIDSLNQLVLKEEMPSIVLQDDEGNPYSGKKYLIEADGNELEGQTDSEGRIKLDKVPSSLSEVHITFWPEDNDLHIKERLHVKLNQLQPKDSPVGIQQRLSNLGYISGPIDGDIGPITEQDIYDLQIAHQLEESKEADTQTIDWIDQETVVV